LVNRRAVTAPAGQSEVKRLSLAVFWFSSANSMWYCSWLLLFCVPFVNLNPTSHELHLLGIKMPLYGRENKKITDKMKKIAHVQAQIKNDVILMIYLDGGSLQ
jgi:hypothetical protein